MGYATQRIGDHQSRGIPCGSHMSSVLWQVTPPTPHQRTSALALAVHDLRRPVTTGTCWVKGTHQSLFASENHLPQPEL